MEVPDLCGLDAQYLDRWPPAGWLLALSCSLAVGGAEVAGAVERATPLPAITWSVLGLVAIVLLVRQRVRPPGVRLGPEGIRSRGPASPWRLTRWEQVQGVDVEERRFFTSAVRVRGGARVPLRGMPPEAAEHLAQALRSMTGPSADVHGC